MCGGVPLIPLVPLWQACGQLFLYIDGLNTDFALNFLSS